MEQGADAHPGDEEEWVKQQVRDHDRALLHRGAMSTSYLIFRGVSNDPFSSGTRPKDTNCEIAGVRWASEQAQSVD
jgi:hypothetical protein